MAMERELLDRLLAGRDPEKLFAKDGLLDDLKKALSERILNAELDEHLDGERSEEKANRRNGHSRKSVLTGASKIELAIPCDRAGTFDPQLIAKYQRRFPDFDAKIVSMYACGMTVREIRGHLEELPGIEVSPDLTSAVTDAVLGEVAEWQNRMMLGHAIFDPETNRHALVDHAFIVAGGEIIKAARNRLGEQLDASQRSQILFLSEGRAH